MNVALGNEARDEITGFTGIVTGKVTYISGCNQSLLTPKIGADGTFKSGEWFDDQRVVAIENGRTVTLDNSDDARP